MVYYADIQSKSGKMMFVFPAETVGKDFKAKKKPPICRSR